MINLYKDLGFKNNLEKPGLFDMDNDTYQNIFNRGISADYIKGGTLSSDVEGATVVESTIITGNSTSLSFVTDISFSVPSNANGAYTSGTIILSDGRQFAINNSTFTIENTTSYNYIYLDTDVSETALQVSSTMSDCIGNNKVLIAMSKYMYMTSELIYKRAIFTINGVNGTNVFGVNGFYGDPAIWIDSSKNTYIQNNCSAKSFTDRTPHYDGDALTELSKIKGKTNDKGELEIDHSTLPEFMQVKLENGETERDLGNTVSMLIRAVAQLNEKVDNLNNQLNKV